MSQPPPASADDSPSTSPKNVRTFSASGENTIACMPVITSVILAAACQSAADGPGCGRAFEHGLGNKVVGEGPCLACGGVEAVAKDGCERGQEGGFDGLVVGGPDPVAGVPGSEGTGVGEKFVEAGHGPHDLGQLLGEPGLLLGQVGGEQGADGRVSRE